MTTKPNDLLGMGLYTPHEAAFYARVSTQTINRWKFGDARTERVFTPQYDFDDEKIITFSEFIMAVAIREIKIKYKVGLQSIRDGIRDSEKRYGIPYPFAMKHVAYILGKKIYIRQPGDDHDIYTQVNTPGCGQAGFAKILELYVENLNYGPNDELHHFEAFEYLYEDNGTPVIKRVLMNPQRRFGEPLVESCGISAKTLYEASLTEKGIEEAADVYGVDRSEVDIACRYFDYLYPGRAAA